MDTETGKRFSLKTKDRDAAKQIILTNLKAEAIDWQNRVIVYSLRKTDSLACIHFGKEVEVILKRLPSSGSLFPYLCAVRSGDRATEFKQPCAGLEITGVTLQSSTIKINEMIRSLSICG